MAESERAFSDESLWPPHPLDEADDEPPLDRVASVYLGAAGVVWALHALERAGDAEPGRDWGGVAATLLERYREKPDFPDQGVVPSLWMGEAGILLVAHTLAPDPSQAEELLAAVLRNVANPTLELMWGAPGTMLAAHVMHERTGAAVWAEAWNESADHIWSAWVDETWCQDLPGDRRRHYLGPAHGFAGNVHALARGDLLDDDRRHELERRVVAFVSRHAERADGLAQWPPTIEDRPASTRTQWCHGAPGMVASLGLLAPDHDGFTEFLLEGGALTWHAGPLEKGAGLCHGTAGNGYAFLKLFERTGDELWLDRARAFAMHAVEQVERTTAQYGRGRHSLWTGDPGTAVYLSSCIAATAAVPTLDVI